MKGARITQLKVLGGGNVAEKKQRFFQTVKCPCCGAETSFEWEAVVVGSITTQEVR